MKFDMEEWRKVDGFGENYQINRDGVVKNMTPGRYFGHIMKPFKRRRQLCVQLKTTQGTQRGICIDILLKAAFPELRSDKVAVKDLPGEVWKDIPGFVGKYMCSNKGRIKTLERDYLAGMGYACVRHIDEAILSPTESKRGYLRVDLRGGSSDSHNQKWVHNIVARVFFDNWDESLVPNHIDGNKKNNCIENLELIPVVRNIRHALATGLKKMNGEDNPGALLTNKQSDDIRKRYANGERQVDIAKSYNIDRQIVYRIVHGKSYVPCRIKTY